MGRVRQALPALLAVVLLSSCESYLPELAPPEIDQVEDRIYITDKTGKSWDITDAVQIHGMDAEKFTAGFGPDAIQPINEPAMIEHGDKRYPGADEEFSVIGFALEGEARAYRISDLNKHEVVNEEIEGHKLLVAW